MERLAIVPTDLSLRGLGVLASNDVDDAWHGETHYGAKRENQNVLRIHSDFSCERTSSGEEESD